MSLEELTSRLEALSKEIAEARADSDLRSTFAAAPDRDPRPLRRWRHAPRLGADPVRQPGAA